MKNEKTTKQNLANKTTRLYFESMNNIELSYKFLDSCVLRNTQLHKQLAVAYGYVDTFKVFNSLTMTELVDCYTTLNNVDNDNTNDSNDTTTQYILDSNKLESFIYNINLFNTNKSCIYELYSYIDSDSMIVEYSELLELVEYIVDNTDFNNTLYHYHNSGELLDELLTSCIDTVETVHHKYTVIDCESNSGAYNVSLLDSCYKLAINVQRQNIKENNDTCIVIVDNESNNIIDTIMDSNN